MMHRRLPLPKPGTIITRAVLDRLGACRIPAWWDQLDPKDKGVKLTRRNLYRAARLDGADLDITLAWVLLNRAGVDWCLPLSKEYRQFADWNDTQWDRGRPASVQAQARKIADILKLEAYR